MSFVRADRVPDEDEWNRFLELAPDLAVEVVSPSDTAREIFDKVGEYLDAGVQMMWIVNPFRRTVMVYLPDRTGRLLAESDTLDGGNVLPGFALPVSRIVA